jgi:DHA2 family multidrug resistance protein
MLLFTCTAVTFLYAMTVTIANVSMPQMQGALSATPDQIAWVLTSNIVATAVATPMAGWLVSRFGWRKLCLGCVVGFAVASLGCGMADSLETLVFWRALQGAFGAPLVPVSQAIVLDSYPKERHGAVIAIFGMGSVVGPIVGPVLGGYLSEAYNWRWVFYMILPFCVVAFAGVWVYIHDRHAPKKVDLDWTGFLTLSAALASFQLMLDRGERVDWFDSAEIVAYAAVAGLALYLFIAHTLTRKHPFLDPALLKDRNFTIGLILIFVFGMLNFTPMSLLPPLLQGIAGYPDSVIGFVIGARGIGTMIAFFLMIFLSRLDPRGMILLGFLLQGLAGWQLTQLDANVSTADVFWPMALQGFGVGILWVPITMVTFATLNTAFIAEGTAIYHMLRNIGSSVHISLSTVLVVRMTQVHHSELSERISPYEDNLSLPFARGEWSMDALQAEVQRQANMIGYLDAFWFFILTAVAVLPLILLVRWKKR